MSDQGFPNLSAPIVGPSGTPTPAWQRFFINIWNRTGGSAGSGGVGFSSGDTKPWPGASIPDGWIPCDGRPVSRAAYAGLFGVIGTTWGHGDGSSTFNVPDFRGRTLIGAGTGSGLTARTLGQTGGFETNTLNTAQLPSHTHPVNDPGHTHTITDPGHSHSALVAASTNTAGAAAGASTAGNTGSASTGITINSATTGLTVGSTGTGAPITNMQPFAVVQWIIKT